MPLVPPVWVLILCLLATAGAAIVQRLLASRLRNRLLARARRDGRVYFTEIDKAISLRLAAAMPGAGFPIGTAAVSGRHVIIDSEPVTGNQTRQGACRVDFVIGSVRLRSNRSRVVAFRMSPDAVEITHVADASGPLATQFDEALDSLRVTPSTNPLPGLVADQAYSRTTTR